MDLPMSFTGKYGEMVCELDVVSWSYNDDNDERISEHGKCGAEVYVIWELCVPITDDITRMEAPEAAKYRTTDRWTVECTNGHVLARSNMGGAEDTAEPIDLDTLMGTHQHGDILPPGFVDSLQPSSGMDGRQ